MAKTRPASATPGGRPTFIDEVHLYTDGGCRGNPGPGAIGTVIFDSAGNELERHAECIGESTNNRAEYRALISGLDLCAKHTRRRVRVFADSELLIRQMTGTYRLKNNELRALFRRAKEMERPFEEVVYQQVPRTHQKMRIADRILNEAFEGR